MQDGQEILAFSKDFSIFDFHLSEHFSFETVSARFSRIRLSLSRTLPSIGHSSPCVQTLLISLLKATLSPMRQFFSGFAVLLVLSIFSPPAFAQQSFTDVPQDHPAYAAIEHLKSIGVLQGYPDPKALGAPLRGGDPSGRTFQPDRTVNRAEATKIIVAPRATADALATFTTSPFMDVPEGVWYLPYAEMGRQVFGFLDGPPKRMKFEGERGVQKVEFLKMLLTTYQVDTSAFSEITLPLARDVTDANAWYYPHLRYSLTASMTMVGNDGLLSPAKPLTRGEVALLLYRFLMYRENRRTQALLSEAEQEIVRILDALGKNDILQAEYASARALLASRGAHASRPDTPLVKAALKVTEAFRTLVRAYRAGLNKDFNMVIELTKQAWTLSNQALEYSADMGPIVEQLQASAHAMAESARSLGRKP